MESVRWLNKIRANGLLLAFFVIVFLATYKYIAYPEPYTFETTWGGERVLLGPEIITQDLVIDEKADWGGKAQYAIYFDIDHPVSEGTVKITLSQNQEVVSSCQISASKIQPGFYTLRDLDYSCLMDGIATISIQTSEIEGQLYLGIVPNLYNLPNYFINGKDMGSTLAQRFHFYFVNKEFIARQICYVLFFIVNILALIIFMQCDENKWWCRITQSILIISYFCLVFIYDSVVFLAPAWAESITNFIHSGMEYGLIKNLLISDNGYLPLFQRIVTLIIVKVFHISAYHAIYIMQATAYLLSGFIMSFFTNYKFRRYFELKYRYIICLLFMMYTFHINTSTFINFMGYAALPIFLYFLTDSGEWSRRDFCFLCLWGFLAGASKGSQVTLFPFMAVSLLLFSKKNQKRDRIFIVICMSGAFIQMIYYFFQRLSGNGLDWIDRTHSLGGSRYLLKLICSLIIDAPNAVIAFLGGNTGIANGLSIPILFFFWLVASIFIFKKILTKWLNGKEPEREYVNILCYLIYIVIQSLFFRVTIRGVSGYQICSDEFWSFNWYGAGDKYQMYLQVAVFCLCIALVKLIEKEYRKSVQKLAIVFWAVCIMATSPRLQLKGLNTDSYVVNRGYIATRSVEMSLLRDIESAECRIVPIAPNGWIYGKNATCYCFGKNVFDWGGGQLCMVEDALNNDFTAGKLNLTEYQMIPSNCDIWQIFVSRPSLINLEEYQVVLKDQQDNILLQVHQDNPSHQMIVSFTFEHAVNNIAQIEILDADGNSIHIQNGIYVVIAQKDDFI